MKNLEEFIENSKPFTKDDKLKNLFVNDRYDLFAIFESGRVFKKRAKGNSGTYDLWREIDIKKEIESDLFPTPYREK